MHYSPGNGMAVGFGVLCGIVMLVGGALGATAGYLGAQIFHRDQAKRWTWIGALVLGVVIPFLFALSCLLLFLF